MAANPPARRVAIAPQPGRFARPDFRFGREVYAELKKVIWPTWIQIRDLTVVVCVLSGAVGALLGGIDYLFSEIVRFLLVP